MTLVAATFVLLAVLHSILGEVLLLGPLLSAPLPQLRMGRWLGARTLRFAWHLTSLAWVGLAASALSPAQVPLIASATLLVSGLVAFIGSRGQHFAWAVFVAGGLIGLDALPDQVAALVAGGLLVVISALHVAWAFGFRGGSSVAIPSVEGRAAFRPGPVLTLAVAVAFATGAVVAWQAPSGGGWRWLAIAGAVVCGARTIGDAKLVGLFKRVRGTPFSAWDDLLFTPLSFVLALCFGVLAT
ncbi:MAG: DUF3995 domain-containing protein [Archangiaceae bacterium]|nr:DUF3995 domain-containing protein [Archangiaceae bacterium]